MVIAAYISGVLIGFATGWSIQKRIRKHSLLMMLRLGVLVVDETKFKQLEREIKR